MVSLLVHLLLTYCTNATSCGSLCCCVSAKSSPHIAWLCGFVCSYGSTDGESSQVRACAATQLGDHKTWFGKKTWRKRAHLCTSAFAFFFFFEHLDLDRQMSLLSLVPMLLYARHNLSNTRTFESHDGKYLRFQARDFPAVNLETSH